MKRKVTVLIEQRECYINDVLTQLNTSHTLSHVNQSDFVNAETNWQYYSFIIENAHLKLLFQLQLARSTRGYTIIYIYRTYSHLAKPNLSFSTENRTEQFLTNYIVQ